MFLVFEFYCINKKIIYDYFILKLLKCIIKYDLNAQYFG